MLINLYSSHFKRNRLSFTYRKHLHLSGESRELYVIEKSEISRKNKQKHVVVSSPYGKFAVNSTKYWSIIKYVGYSLKNKIKNGVMFIASKIKIDLNNKKKGRKAVFFKMH